MLDVYQLLLAFSLGGLLTFLMIKVGNRNTINYPFVVRLLNDLAISMESYDPVKNTINMVSEDLHKYPELLAAKKRIMQALQTILLR